MTVFSDREVSRLRRRIMPGASVAAGLVVVIVTGCAGHHLSPPKTTPTPSASASPTASPSSSPSASPTASPSASPSSLTLTSELQTLQQGAYEINSVVLNPADNSWVVVYDADQYVSLGIPAACSAQLTKLMAAGATIGPIALGPNGSWVVVNGTNQFVSSGITTDMYNVLATASTNATQKITAVSIAPDGSWVIILNNATVQSAGVPAGLTTYLQTIVGSGVPISHVALGPNSTYAVIAGTARSNTSGAPTALTANLATLLASNVNITSVTLGLTGSYAVTYQQNSYFVSATRAEGTSGVVAQYTKPKP